MQCRAYCKASINKEVLRSAFPPQAFDQLQQWPLMLSSQRRSQGLDSIRKGAWILIHTILDVAYQIIPHPRQSISITMYQSPPNLTRRPHPFFLQKKIPTPRPWRWLHKPHDPVQLTLLIPSVHVYVSFRRGYIRNSQTFRLWWLARMSRCPTYVLGFWAHDLSISCPLLFFVCYDRSYLVLDHECHPISTSNLYFPFFTHA